MNARNLGIGLAIGWVVMPFAACVAAFITFFADDKLGVLSIALSTLLSLPFIIGTAIYTLIAIQRCVALPRTRIVPHLLLILPLSGVIGWSVVANVTPRRITPDTVTDSPFDKYWYSAPQTAYGCPSPFLRFFDSTMPDSGYPNIGGTLFDISSFLGDLTIWSFLVFVAVSVTYTLLPPQCNAEQTNARERTLLSALSVRDV
jgi:hypothetical protein